MWRGDSVSVLHITSSISRCPSMSLPLVSFSMKLQICSLLFPWFECYVNGDLWKKTSLHTLRLQKSIATLKLEFSKGRNSIFETEGCDYIRTCIPPFFQRQLHNSYYFQWFDRTLSFQTGCLKTQLHQWIQGLCFLSVLKKKNMV